MWYITVRDHVAQVLNAPQKGTLVIVNLLVFPFNKLLLRQQMSIYVSSVEQNVRHVNKRKSCKIARQTYKWIKCVLLHFETAKYQWHCIFINRAQIKSPHFFNIPQIKVWFTLRLQNWHRRLVGSFPSIVLPKFPVKLRWQLNLKPFGENWRRSTFDTFEVSTRYTVVS